MRTLSKQKLQRMHAMLDKQLQNEQQFTSKQSITSQRRKQKSDFHHLRYSSDLKLDQDIGQLESKKKDDSAMFKANLQKGEALKKQVNRGKVNGNYGNLSSSDEERDNEQGQTKNSMKGSRKSEIDQLEKKLFDLEKKMQNIEITSSQEQQQSTIKPKPNIKNPPSKKLIKNDSKKSLNALKLQENDAEWNPHLQSRNTTQGTARFCGNLRQEPNKKTFEKIQFRSNLPLSHRKNTQQQEQSNSDEQFQVRYEKFVKVSKGQQNIKKTEKKPVYQESEEEDSSDQIEKNRFHNKSITEQIQRLSIMNKESMNKTKQSKEKLKDKQGEQNRQQSIEKQKKIKINSIVPPPERKTTVQHETLEPKYKVQSKKDKSMSKEKKLSVGISKKSLSKDKSLSTKNLQVVAKQPNSKKSIERNYTNLDNSFRSDNSAKSKKSMNSMRSVGSNKSLSRKQLTQGLKIQSVQQKKYQKRIQNLQKQLQHYKRLSKRQQSRLNDYKLLQIQYKKLQTQFKKSQLIRMQQKKIIENFRNNTMNV